MTSALARTRIARTILFVACALACALVSICLAPSRAIAQQDASAACPARPAAGSVAAEPENLRSHGGVLRVDFTYRNFVDSTGQLHYCYLYNDGTEAPTLRLKPGDLLILHLKNEITVASQPSSPLAAPPAQPPPLLTLPQPPNPAPDRVPHASASRAHDPHAHEMSASACTTGPMNASSTNLHFHGLSVPPVCHEDDVLNTMVDPGDKPFEYRFRIPLDEPPGLYWYHPHVHGLTKAQVLGGASGALIVEGIERANPTLAGLPERVFIIRDQELLNPNAAPVQTDSMPAPLVMRDAEGDILNTGTGGGKPAKDLSINFVPVAYPTYPPAIIKIRPAEKQLWCVLNASAITYLDLQLLFDNKPQMMGVVSLDGVPINASGAPANRILYESHILLPPAGRVGIIVQAPPGGAKASFVTRTVDTGPAGENDPTRPLATIIAAADAPESPTRLASAPLPLPRPTSAWLGNVKPVRTRKLYFSEQPHDPKNPNSLTDFFITVEGQQPKLFDPNDPTPNIVAQQGDVEDWIVENRTQELHAFHIHQIHFMLLEYNGIPLDEPFLRDTINVGYWDGKSRSYPSVKLRMDFRDPNVVGTFVYHCHLLEHEDGGMMGVIRVVPKNSPKGTPANLLGARAPLGRPLCGLPKHYAVVRDVTHREGASRVAAHRTSASHSTSARRRTSARLNVAQHTVARRDVARTSTRGFYSATHATPVNNKYRAATRREVGKFLTRCHLALTNSAYLYAARV
jgi:FtsP/CotA-like multicopper oxidase with cupredoxin domain